MAIYLSMDSGVVRWLSGIVVGMVSATKDRSLSKIHVLKPYHICVSSMHGARWLGGLLDIYINFELLNERISTENFLK